MLKPSEYQKAYETAKRELAELLTQQHKLEKRIVVVRKAIQTFASLCESEGTSIARSQEADYLLEHSSLADEIRTILSAHYPGWLPPSAVKAHLIRLGHDLSKYQNSQATIHMVLKRMYDSGEIQEVTLPEDGKKVYRRYGSKVPPPPSSPARKAMGG